MEKRHAIRALDPLIIGKIAAGEVVERPAFAIKELIENSIDAGATAIAVEIRDGGLSYFRVTDNGCGIAPEDIRMAFARHATSKLRHAEDLDAIHTLGFRGEALASIAAVARVALTTRAAGSVMGTKAMVAGGVFETISEAASPEGTSIVVKDLFYNTPARRKFLKKPATEAGLVSDVVMRLILARPDISFRLHNAEKQVYHSPGNGSLKDALFSVMGKEAIVSLVEVKGSVAGCAIHGFVGVGEAARRSRSMQTFILNGRYVRNQFLSQALEEGCHERVMIGKYPVCALHLTMAYENVDVNVHPNKLEVRFSDERALMTGLSGMVRQAFAVEPMQAAPKLEVTPRSQEEDSGYSALPIKPPAPPDRPSVRIRDSAIMPGVDINRPPVLFPDSFAEQDIPKKSVAQEIEQETLPIPEASSNAEKPLQAVGVAWYEYIFVTQENTLYIIDQHAAHERILYERFQNVMDQQVASQQLLVPQVIQLTHREHTTILGNLDILFEIGFDIEDFGDRSIQVRAVPVVLGRPELTSFFGDLADSLLEYRALPTQVQRRDALVKYACKKAVKAGDSLSVESIESLLAQMKKTGAPPTCPHGRPLVVAIEKTELDKRFRRLV